MREYRHDLDILKGISIIAVVLYHIGILPYGYLGVDTFLIINGFLIIPGLIKAIEEGNFSFIGWFLRRMKRFVPIVLIASIVCLAIGFFVMIPDDYENLSQSVFASSIFCQNILSAITTGNYWDSVNEYKPLMHFWYLGIVVQFYFIVSIILLIINKICRIGGGKKLRITVLLLGGLSLLLYVCPFSFNSKFYYLPFRIWEFCLGGLVGLYVVAKDVRVASRHSVLSLVLLIICFCLFPKNFSDIDTTVIIGAQEMSGTGNIPRELPVIATVLLSSVLMLRKEGSFWNKCGWLAVLGKMSLSIFVWHQVLLAFFRYSLVDRITAGVFLVFVGLLLLLSYASYRLIEPLKINTKAGWVMATLIWAGVLCYSFAIYRRAGVVRDVPELGITMDNPLVNKNTEYIDRIYAYDKPFASANQIKVLVVGNSFARDFACVLLEWDVEHRLELSYMFSFDKAKGDRLSECDYLFVLGSKEYVPSYVWSLLKKDCKSYGISTKSYGKNFGRIYARRHQPDYYESSLPIHPLCAQTNDEWRKSWGGNFLDFMEASKLPNGNIRLFTDDHKIISFDCRHLTMYGCKFYAKTFDFEQMFASSRNQRN